MTSRVLDSLRITLVGASCVLLSSLGLLLSLIAVIIGYLFPFLRPTVPRLEFRRASKRTLPRSTPGFRASPKSLRARGFSTSSTSSAAPSFSSVENLPDKLSGTSRVTLQKENPVYRSCSVPVGWDSKEHDLEHTSNTRPPLRRNRTSFAKRVRASADSASASVIRATRNSVVFPPSLSRSSSRKPTPSSASSDGNNSDDEFDNLSLSFSEPSDDASSGGSCSLKPTERKAGTTKTNLKKATKATTKLVKRCRFDVPVNAVARKSQKVIDTMTEVIQEDSLTRPLRAIRPSLTRRFKSANTLEDEIAEEDKNYQHDADVPRRDSGILQGPVTVSDQA